MNIIFYVIVAILIFDFVLERILNHINSSYSTCQLPKELEGIYDDKEYAKQQNYKKELDKFDIISSSFSFILIMLMLFFDGFAFVDDIAKSYTEHVILQALIFFGIIMFASDILGTPFSIYSTFVIEEKYGFNKTTPKLFILDKLKGWLLTAILGGGILSFIIWLIQSFENNFWIYAWIVVAGFMIFMTMFYSSLIVPLFNKQKPLEAGELRTEIEKFSQNVGFKLDNIFVIDGSKRSTKANAYFSGLGSKKRIVLYDTLINDLSIQEIVAVLAHEVGHYKKKHTLQMIFLSLLQTGLMFFILGFFINNPALSMALNVEEHSIHIALITFGILYTPLSFIIGIFLNMLSRKNEYEADQFASDNYNGDDIINALKKLSQKNLSNLTPHPLYVFFYYSHPTLLQRILNIKKK
jgi:STE24 endopeptidase